MALHARELVELAALVSHHGPVFIQARCDVAGESLEQYWVASKCRLDRWMRCLQPHISSQVDATSRAEQLPGVIEEIFTGEVLTRVWTAVLAARGKMYGQYDGEMIARSVMLSHMEARNRALKTLLHASQFQPQQAVSLNRLRRRSERWSDVLIGRLFPTFDVSAFAADADRAREFALDMQYQGGLMGPNQVWGLLMASLRAAFRQGLVEPSPNADLNERIAAGVLGCFGPEHYDETGQFHSLRLFRLLNDIDDRPLGEPGLFPSVHLNPRVGSSPEPPQDLPPSRPLPSPRRF